MNIKQQYLMFRIYSTIRKDADNCCHHSMLNMPFNEKQLISYGMLNMCTYMDNVIPWSLFTSRPAGICTQCND
jgi:hypothetical protein